MYKHGGTGAHSAEQTVHRPAAASLRYSRGNALAGHRIPERGTTDNNGRERRADNTDDTVRRRQLESGIQRGGHRRDENKRSSVGTLYTNDALRGKTPCVQEPVAARR